MPPITYTPAFQFTEWIDNEDVVQAGGDRGFNKLFNDLRAELTRIGTVVGDIANAINQIQRLRHVKALPAQTLTPGTASPEIDIDQYAQSEVTPNTQKVYFTSMTFVPPGALGQIETFTYYKPGAGDTWRVTMQFKNVGAANTTFIAQVFSLA